MEIKIRRVRLREFTNTEKQIQTLMLFHEFRLTRSTHVTNEDIQHMLSDALIKTKLLKLPLIKIRSQDEKI